MNKTERKVANAILEEAVPVKLGNRVINVSRLRYRNYILISALSAESGITTEEEERVSKELQDKDIPFEDRFNKKNVSILLNFIFKEGVSASKQAELLATMLLNFKAPSSLLEKAYQKFKLDRIKRAILDLTASEFSALKIQLFNQLEYVDFFLNTVSLREINILRETVTTASGQQSED